MRTYEDSRTVTVHEFTLAEFAGLLGIEGSVHLVEVWGSEGVVRVRMDDDG